MSNRFKLYLPRKIKTYLKDHLFKFLTKSLKRAAEEQGLSKLIKNLEEIAPDISDQYSSCRVETPYLRTKIRNMHAFQVSLVNRVINEFQKPVIVDIGDSSGTHLQYIKGLWPKKDVRCLGVNLDEKAVARIKKRGLEALQARAEDLDKYNVGADIFLCFETLEHLMNPIEFLHELSLKTKAKYFIITIPYLKSSRVGLHYIRAKNKDTVDAETVHILEFAPKDWKLLFKFAGWNVAFEKIYFQHPKKHWLQVTKPYWKKYDFEGFYGAILTRDNSWSHLYKDW